MLLTSTVQMMSLHIRRQLHSHMLKDLPFLYRQQTTSKENDILTNFQNDKWAFITNFATVLIHLQTNNLINPYRKLPFDSWRCGGWLVGSGRRNVTVGTAHATWQGLALVHPCACCPLPWNVQLSSKCWNINSQTVSDTACGNKYMSSWLNVCGLELYILILWRISSSRS
jgi:hypothetical protein